MQIQILNGIYTDEAADFRTAYPRNMMPVPKKQGISNGYLRPGDGIVQLTDQAPGADRGAINWNGVCYRAMGTKLISVSESGAITELGDIGGTDRVTFDYSFDRLSITSNGNLFYWDGSTLSQVTDPDLGTSLDHIWVDGYFMSTDGEFLIVTELADPFSILTTKYGSSEADPDPIKAILKLRNEPYALNRHTIEVFDNIGGTGFPFQRIDGAQIQRGTVGTHTCCIFLDQVAFVGGGRNEAIAVWLAVSGTSTKISTREIDQILAQYSETQLSEALLESRMDKGHQHLYLHLPDQTLVFDAAATRELGESVWFTLGTGLEPGSRYLAQNFIWCYGKWLVGDPVNDRIGYITDEISNHWGTLVGWEFTTYLTYNSSRGGIFHELELVCLSGRVALGKDPDIYTQYSLDGEEWSMPRFIKSGKQGERKKRLVWLQQGPMRSWRVQRFRGDSDSHLSVARLEARVEGLDS